MRRVQHAPDFAGIFQKSGIVPKHDLRVLAEKKRDGGELSPAQWGKVVEHALARDADPAQIAALFMACFFQGMSVAETVALTRAMVASGRTLHFTRFTGAVDKHSSGGVGDTASLILVPLLAECGERVAKLSGRALGHTGGTLDKLESIPGVRVELDPEEFERIIADVGCAIAAQSSALVPADKVMYSLRDRTGTVPCVGLIASSIVSKKIAGGADRIVFDVKMGSGAFMKTLPEARALAEMLVTVAQGFGKRSVAIITDMSQPLATAVGNGLEVVLAREFLQGTVRPKRLTEAVRSVAIALVATRLPADAAERVVDCALASPAALARFEAMVEAQGGDLASLRSMRAQGGGVEFCAARSGYVAAVDAEAIGNVAREAIRHGGPLAGVTLEAHIGDYVKAGSTLGLLYGDRSLGSQLSQAFAIVDQPVAAPPVIYQYITEAGTPAAPVLL